MGPTDFSGAAVPRTWASLVFAIRDSRGIIQAWGGTDIRGEVAGLVSGIGIGGPSVPRLTVLQMTRPLGQKGPSILFDLV